MAGVLGLLTLLGWYLWQESVGAEERRLEGLARRLGERAESVLMDSRALLEVLNASDAPRCGRAHVDFMLREAVARPFVRSIAYWEAVERRCGVGFVQGEAPTPSEASKIYPSGVVAWWPGPDTAVGDVELFIMRLGAHSLALDTRLLIDRRLPGEQRAGLWVEGLLMAASPADATLPDPATLPSGLTIDRVNGRLVSRFSLGTVFPMDVVAVQSSSSFLDRYLGTLLTAGGLGLMLMGLWFLFVRRLSRRQLSLAAELRSAIEHNGIDAVYQPIVDLQTGRCRGAEILARWQRADGEVITPDVFIPLAERHRIIGGLTRCMLQRALQELGDFLRQRPDLSINLNLSPLDLEDRLLAGLLESELEAAALPASTFKLEITERALVDHEECRGLIGELRQRGHRIAIDDFGTGYSSLAYLESFELDTLKLDKAFVDATGTEAVTSSVILHIIEMARSLDLDMVAEGIETEEQARWLEGQGVQLGQGYFYSRPLDAGAFMAFAREG
jgi:sensor c-di-GMP phosphodiesterase-like protein